MIVFVKHIFGNSFHIRYREIRTAKSQNTVCNADVHKFRSLI